jgi:hypothetical protein
MSSAPERLTTFSFGTPGGKHFIQLKARPQSSKNQHLNQLNSQHCSRGGGACIADILAPCAIVAKTQHAHGLQASLRLIQSSAAHVLLPVLTGHLIDSRQ